jgi:cytochrome c oxidase assembly protein subunit 15
MTPDEWEEEFGKYKRSPEYRTVNQGMAMDDFKFIYYLEYASPLLRPSVFGARRGWVG